MSYHLQIITELQRLIVEEAKDTEIIICDGVALKDFPTYKEQVGRLYAYRRVLDMFQQAAEIVEKSA